ncbi:MAG: hypothetical protein IJD33_05750 [Clostridia bacterium]|nr:hypothetical protein [Clostridia bacterium]
MVKNTSVCAFSLLFGVAKAIYRRRPAERAPLAEFRQIPVRVIFAVCFRRTHRVKLILRYSVATPLTENACIFFECSESPVQFVF